MATIDCAVMVYGALYIYRLRAGRIYLKATLVVRADLVERVLLKGHKNYCGR